MGTVGINFGSATSGAGFDVSATVTSIVTNLQSVESPWKTQLTSLKAADTAFTTLGTNLATLSSSLQALTDFEGVLASKQGSSSNTNVLALTSASSTAVAGSHSVIVDRLAQTSSAYSDVAASTDILSGGLTFTVGSGSPETVTVGSSSNTLSSYAAAINAAGLGVAASVVTDTNGSRLSLVSKTSGAAGQLSITGALDNATTGNALGTSQGLPGQDAQLQVDGITFDSASNTVSTAIPGVTFQLLTTDPGTAVQVQIANDNTSVVSAFSNLVTSYNAIVGDIKTQEGNDATGAAEPLYGNPVISQLQSSLSLALTSGSASGNISNLTQLGFSVNNDGTLSLNTSALGATLNSNYQDVVGFLQNTGGFGQTFQATLDNLGSESPSGAISLALAENTTQERGLNADVTTQDALIATQKATLTTQLNTANEVLQSIPQQLNSVDELYNALTGYTAKT